MRLDELFELKPGVAASKLDVMEEPFEGSVPLLRPSYSFLGTVAGHIAEASVAPEVVMPADTLFVSTDGEGSHTYSYVAPMRFVANSNVTVLLPRRAMSLAERLYYAKCITLNRPLFSYGRKPKGERLARIQVPDSAPEWVLSIQPLAQKSLSRTELEPVSTEGWGNFRYTDLFEIVRGQGPTQAEAKARPGTTPFVSASDSNNGISAFTSIAPTHAGGALTVATNGSVGETFFQPQPFLASSDVAVLTPKKRIPTEALFAIAALIRREGKLKYGYGRKWGLQRMSESAIKLPVTADGQPDFEPLVSLVERLPSYGLLYGG